MALSTISHDRNNFFNHLLDNKAGFSFRRTGACDICVNKGVAASCVHKLDQIPHFNSGENRDLIRQMMGPARQKQFLIENMGKFQSLKHA